jgi:chemotaxis protein methyltransferase CheR
MDDLSDTTYRAIARLMHSSVGLSFPDSKKALVSSRLATRIQRLGLGGYDDYVSLISDEGDGGEFQVAIDLLTTNETYFFREAPHFQLLEREFATRSQRPVAVWSAASSFGDEAYSIAMALADLQRQARIGDGWWVLGTDISERVLAAAREAVFPAERLRHVSEERLRRYCLRGEGDSDGLVQMRPLLTERVRFGWMNLCEPIDPPGPFDVIFLRNVLIYFDTPTRNAVIEQVLGQLRPGGLLFIGMSEGRIVSGLPLQALGAGAFRKLERK